MRFERAITLHLFRPVSRFAPGLRASQVNGVGHPVPVLMYHSISEDAEPGLNAYYQTNTTPQAFRQQMQFLASRGYHTVALRDLVTSLQPGGSDGSSAPLGASTSPFASGKAVALTFDDGFSDFFSKAFPILRQHGFTATVFLPTAFIGDAPRQFQPAARSRRLSASKQCLTWAEVKELRRGGIEFGSHTVNHPKLVELSTGTIRSELLDSKSEMEQRLGEPVDAFCYPFAFPQADARFARTFRDLLIEAGYTSCSTTEIGRVRPGNDPFRLRRLPANSMDDDSLLEAKLEGAYDWLATPQSLAKKLKALLRRSKGNSSAPSVKPLAQPN